LESISKYCGAVEGINANQKGSLHHKTQVISVSAVTSSFFLFGNWTVQVNALLGLFGALASKIDVSFAS